MDILTGILVTSAIIDTVRNIYELTFNVSDDPVKERILKYQTSKFDKNSKVEHYYITIEGNRIIDIKPMD